MCPGPSKGIGSMPGSHPIINAIISHPLHMLMQGVVFYVQKESALRLRTDRFRIRVTGRDLLGSDLLLYHLRVGDHGPGLLVQRKKNRCHNLVPGAYGTVEMWEE